MTDLINQSMNYEAVYRTSPATPGLLNMKLYNCFPGIFMKNAMLENPTALWNIPSIY